MTDLAGARVLVAGATGVLGGAITDALLDKRARVVPAGRKRERLAEVAARCGTNGLLFEAVDLDSCRAVVEGATGQLGGLDGLVVASGVAGFGPGLEADEAVTEELFAVNTLAPMALVRAAAPRLSERGFAVVLSAILADLPTAGMAEYSASKAALAAWLSAVRRELRPRALVDVRPPHLETGLADRALVGTPPKLPEGYPVEDLVAKVVTAIEKGAKEVVWSRDEKDLVVR